MGTPGRAENGDRRTRPRLPLGIAIGSIVVAIASASLLIFVLYRETKGPGEILREFARLVDKNDCAASYELLDESVRAGLTGDEWCTLTLPSVDGGIDADFTLEQAVLAGDIAEVEVSGVTLTRWELRRFGERSWRVVGPEGGFPEAMLEGASQP